MRTISAENLAALEARQLIARDFLWLEVRRRADNTPVTEGLWSDVGNVSAAIIHPDTGLPVTRDWFGSGSLVQIDDLPLVSNLSVQNINIRLNQIDDRIERLVRDYDCKQGRVEIYRGLFDPASRRMVAPAECRFVGFVDMIDITTPSENDEGTVIVACVSHTQELTRSNPDTRSDASQRVRLASDGFFQDSGTVSEFELFWGNQKGKVPTQKRKKFLGIF